MMDTMDRGSIYDHDIPSLSASLEAFDPERSIHSTYSGRSNMHSSRWSAPQEEPESEAESDGPWAPPAWQKSHSSNHWYRKSMMNENAPRPSFSRSPSYFRKEKEDSPSRIPLPESPSKHTPRTSPEPMSAEEQRYMADSIASRLDGSSADPLAGSEAQNADDMALSHHEEAGQLDGCR